jgi:hypothetical protein
LTVAAFIPAALLPRRKHEAAEAAAPGGEE